MNLPLGHVRCPTKLGPDRISRLDVNWINKQTDRPIDRQANILIDISYIYLLIYLTYTYRYIKHILIQHIFCISAFTLFAFIMFSSNRYPSNPSKFVMMILQANQKKNAT